jgi:hypothetical protein
MPLENKAAFEITGAKAALHSRYNPVAEAEKYVNSLSLRQGICFFVLIEPGEGYLIPFLQKKIPEAKIIPLHVEDEDVQSILSKAISDTTADKIEIVEWRPSLAAYGKRYLRLLEETAAFIKRADANKRTADYFGKKWFRNFLKNVSLVKEAVVFRPYDGSAGTGTCPPCIVAGAGPSLEESIPLIARMQRRGCFVLAASSAVAALLSGGIVPNMAIATDGGNWALFHLCESFRSGNGGGKPPHEKLLLAITTNAAVPSQAAAFPTLLISDGSRWQNAALKSLGLPFIGMAQRGTVTASAVDLAFALTGGDVFIAGVDLADIDIKSHARPYALDFFTNEASRLRPCYSEAFSRTVDGNSSMNIYAEWFRQMLPAYPRPFFTIGVNNPVFSGLPTWKDAPSMRPFLPELIADGVFEKFEKSEKKAMPVKPNGPPNIGNFSTITDFAAYAAMKSNSSRLIGNIAAGIIKRTRQITVKQVAETLINALDQEAVRELSAILLPDETADKQKIAKEIERVLFC